MIRVYSEQCYQKRYRIKKRYYWRPQRFVLNLILLLFIVGLMLLAFSISTKADQAPKSIIIHTGDTLWSIAQKAHPENDPRETIEAIRNVNHLNNVDVQPGQKILVP